MAKKEAGNLSIWEQMCETPDEAKKLIEGGRLKGFTDISPQYRYKKMTEIYGPIGIGWKCEVQNMTEIPAGDRGEVIARVVLSLHTKVGDHEDGRPIWSAGIVGIGGAMLVCMEKHGLYVNDEAWASAETNAMGKAMKKLGMASDVYEGGYSKYDTPADPAPPSAGSSKKPSPARSKGDPMAALEIGKIATGKATIESWKVVWKKEDGSSSKWAIETVAGAELYTFKRPVQAAVEEIGAGVECHIEVKASMYKDKRQYELLKIVQVADQKEMFEDQPEEQPEPALIGGEGAETPF